MTASILDHAAPVVPLSDSRGNAAALAALYESAVRNEPVAISIQIAEQRA
jgi:hypothetical protein